MGVKNHGFQDAGPQDVWEPLSMSSISLLQDGCACRCQAGRTKTGHLGQKYPRGAWRASFQDVLCQAAVVAGNFYGLCVCLRGGEEHPSLAV